MGPAPRTWGRLVVDYARAWNCDEDAQRLALLRDIWQEDGEFRDPMVACRGAAPLSDHIGRMRRRFPGLRLQVTSGPRRDGDKVSFDWSLGFGEQPDARGRARPAVTGRDTLHLSEDGRIAALDGRWDGRRSRASARPTR